MLETNDNPVMFLREKRTAVHPYPHRAMMFTGYYRPIRRSNNGGQATSVFAQGNSVSGEAFFGGVRPHLKNGPEPIDEPEISSAEAQAAPVPGKNQKPLSQEHHYQNEVHYQHKQQQHHEHHHHEEEEEQHRQQDSLIPQVWKIVKLLICSHNINKKVF